MKRNLLLTMAAAGMWLLGSVPAFAACPTGLSGTQLAAGLWTIKIEGFKTDTGGAATDPDPQSEGCFGVIQSDGACDIAAGDIICAFNNTITAPTTIGGIPAFAGTVSGARDVGQYSFNSNNTGSLTIIDAPSGKTMSFGIVAGLGNSVMQGASIFSGGSSLADPLILTVQKRDQTITAAQFASATSVAFDPAGGGVGGNGLGKGFDAVGVATEQHLDPETGSTQEGGGTIFFNVDGGYDSDVVPGVQIFPSSLICDFHSTLLQQNTGAGQDGTELTSAALDGDYGCPLAGAAFQTASVLYGTTNSSAYVATTGSAGAAAHGLAIANGTKAIMAGSDTGAGVVLVASPTNQHPTKTITVTNGSTEPLDWTNVTINGVADVTATTNTQTQNSQCTGAGTPAACCTGATMGFCSPLNCTGANTPFVGCTGPGTALCPTSGDLAAWNPVATGAVKPTCTIIFTDSGATCTTGSPEIGTWELVGGDHTMITGTPNGTGITFSLKCS
jgi:hypothetical protein